MSIYSLLPVLLLLSGCASTVLSDPYRSGPCFRGQIDDPLLQQELDQSTPCCATYAAMSFERLSWPVNQLAYGSSRDGPLPLPQPSIEYPFDVSLSRTSPTFAFPSGKSRFAAVDLSALPRRPASLDVVPLASGLASTQVTCEGLDKFTKPSGLPRFVRPIVTFLNSEKEPIRTAVNGSRTITLGKGGLSFEIPSAARYLVLHTDPKRYGEEFHLRGNAGITSVFVPGRGLVSAAYDETRDGTTAATGVLELYFHYDQ